MKSQTQLIMTSDSFRAIVDDMITRMNRRNECPETFE